MNYLPHRYSEKSVTRFIPILETLIAKHNSTNEGVGFDPDKLGLSVETAIARLRDAVHSLSHGLVSSPRIDSSILLSVWRNYHVTSNGVQVLIARRYEQSTAFEMVSTIGRLATLQTDQPNFVEIVTALAVLLGHRTLQGAVTINGPLDPVLQQTLEAKYDIVLSATGPQQHTML